MLTYADSDLSWLDADRNNLYVKKIDLNKFLVNLVYIIGVDY
jgi:hypothetical protein